MADKRLRIHDQQVLKSRLRITIEFDGIYAYWLAKDVDMDNRRTSSKTDDYYDMLVDLFNDTEVQALLKRSKPPL